MTKLSAAVWGGLIGAAGALVVNFLLGPARDTTFDAGYQSRLDFALAEGRRAAAAQEQEMMADFERLKRNAAAPKST